MGPNTYIRKEWRATPRSVFASDKDGLDVRVGGPERGHGRGRGSIPLVYFIYLTVLFGSTGLLTRSLDVVLVYGVPNRIE